MKEIYERIQGWIYYSCFLCLWISRATEKHYKVKEWPQKGDFVSGEANIKNMPLDKDRDAFENLKEVFPKLSDGKLNEERIFIGPRIRKIRKDAKFEEKLKFVQLQAWKSLKALS
ncbi:unnamed protein product [Euphydryas editha]|uniref:Uncharacterized protein n=1 Tax=Euphydryas editha TaxID=104508 RepID=A0AAU9U9W5_EUPED|nr:unnamed protein product [Euphydryas editha]